MWHGLTEFCLEKRLIGANALSERLQSKRSFDITSWLLSSPSSIADTENQNRLKNIEKVAVKTKKIEVKKIGKRGTLQDILTADVLHLMHSEQGKTYTK